MREHPILFSGEMVKALLAGRKTQTRRIVKPQSDILTDEVMQRPDLRIAREGKCGFIARWGNASYGPLHCPYGRRGDLLWVRESMKLREHYNGDRWVFSADDSPIIPNATSAAARAWADQKNAKKVRHCPGIHMPRWASRLTLEVTEVRVQRLQDITEADARAEGVDQTILGPPQPNGHRLAFAALWDSINGDRADWASNPWVWAVTFRRLEVS